MLKSYTRKTLRNREAKADWIVVICLEYKVIWKTVSDVIFSKTESSMKQVSLLINPKLLLISWPGILSE